MLQDVTALIYLFFMREGGKIEMADSEVPCSMNEVEPCDCSRWRPGMKTRPRSGTPGDNE